MSGKKVVIFGTGDFARVASVYLTKDSPYEVVAFTVHEAYHSAQELLGKPIVPFERLTELYPPARMPCSWPWAIAGSTKRGRKCITHAKLWAYECHYVNSPAMTWSEITLGDNCFIFEANVIQPFVHIGNNVVLWSGNHVGHDAVIGDHCFIASHAVISGRANIGDYCCLGVNATLRDNVKIGEESVIGAGALIVRDVPAKSVVKGIAGELSKVSSDRIKL